MKRLLTLSIICVSAFLCMTVAAYADDEECTHDWSDWTIDWAATCTEEGHQHRECMTCQTIEEESIPLADHKWSAWQTDYYADCVEAGQKSRYCVDCDATETQTIPATGKHVWGSWYTVTGATIFRTGVREHYCVNCGTSQRGTIAKLSPFAKFTQSKYRVYKGSKMQMKSLLSFASGDTVKSWKTSKKKVVSITKAGKIKAKKKGTAKITVTLKSGKKATCTIKVVKKPKKSKKSVYITRTGIRYHCDKYCWGLRNARALYKVSLSTAKKKGLTPCLVCY